jgi:hypothetical protein
MSHTKYNSDGNLTRWIDSQISFERHKKQLDSIYSQLNKNSLQALGIKNETFKFMQTKMKNCYQMQKFNQNGQ